MNNNTSFDDLLDLWVTRKINLDELAMQGGRTLTDAREQAELHLVATHAIQNYAIASQVSAVHNRYAGGRRVHTIASPVLPPDEKVVSINRSKWFMRIAASVALIAGLYFAQENIFVNPDRLYNSYFQEYHVNTERSLGIENKTTLVQLFREGKFDRVIQTFGGLSSPSNREIFLTGYAYLIGGNFKEAEQLFSAIISNNKVNTEELYQDEAEYYLALTYLKMGTTEKAYEMMKIIKEDKGHTFNETVSNWTLFRMKWFN
jgi:tetratricopeptide (TPR) repeat protein